MLKRGVPYLGLCRGSQLLNVAMGGTLYFDIAAETGCMHREREFFIDSLLVRIHFIIQMILVDRPHAMGV